MITKRVQYRYDSVRNKIGMTDPDGGLHTYTYDVMRRLTGVINPLGERTTYTYDLNGRRTSVQLANGTRTSYVYDVASRVQSVHTLKSDDSTVSKFEYEYDGNGRRTSVLEAGGSRVTWTYDSISQVTSEWRTGTSPYRHTFTYDKVGNRTLKVEDGARTTLVYDAANQLVTSEDAGGTTTFTYDGNGNQTVVQKPSGDRTTQVWDYENRLIKTIQPSGGVTSMAYDADGLRLKKEDATGTKLFVWDDQNYLAETDATGTTETAFTTEPSTYGSLISHRKAGASTTYHFDALGSTRALTDVSEAVLERYNYTAFGTLLGSPTLLTPFLWGGMVGYYWDADLATQYIRARHYQPAIARWISLDPIGFAGGDANLFRYVGNSPTSGGMERRVRLSAAAYGQWQLAVARSALSHLLLANAYEESMGRLLWLDPSGLDEFGTGVDPYNPDTWPRGTVTSGPTPGVAGGVTGAIVGGAITQRSVCRVSFHCYQVGGGVSPFEHCGFTIETTIPFPGVGVRVGPTWIDAGPGGVPVGGISSTIVEYNPPSIGFGGGTRSGIKEVPPVKDYEPSVCECILRKSAAFTGRHSYFVSGPNSNSYLNCISKSCGLTVPREARGLGFDDQWCIRRREPRLYGMHADQPCPCVEWLNCNDL